ncbi:MAG: hypothetical protein KIT16_09490 [Rhodospirillaceae bacterium]|nr:hypothetical protein [Rhodospirillaceae bacterium]
MKTTLLTAVAAIALSLGAATASQAETKSPDTFAGISLEKNPQIAQAGCFYRYFYVYNGYGYYYQYRYICY